jgi:hypothetical protein
VAPNELAKLDRGQWIDPDHGSIEWADYSEQVIADRLHLSTRTIETDRLCHDRVKAWIGDVPLSRITHEELRRLMAELTAAGYAAETVARTMRWVKLTLNQAARDRRILFSPGDGLRLPRPRRTEMRILDATQVDQLATALPDRYGSLATVAAYTGLRWGELAGLQVANIDRRRRRLFVQSSLIEASGQQPVLGSRSPQHQSEPSPSPRSPSTPSITISMNTRRLAQPSGQPKQVGSSDEEPSGGSGVKQSFNQSGRRAESTTCDSPTPLG